jgi:S-adenosylmethionine hydrolase
VPVISLTTDFGLQDGFVGVLKGVIWGICPAAHIADITHLVAPQNVMEGALTLWRAAPFFPAGSIHVAVVDPGVGTKRRPIAARLGSQLYVVPDNGLLTPLLEEAEKAGAPVEFVHLDKSQFWRPDVSHTFHGRDIFAPVAAHLANGVPLIEVGTPISNPVRLALSCPELIPGGWRAHVRMVDVFGNLATDLPAAQIPDLGAVSVRALGREIDGIVPSYGHRQPGALVALVDSENYVEVAVVNGSAAKVLGAKVGDVVEIIQK